MILRYNEKKENDNIRNMGFKVIFYFKYLNNEC